MPQDGSEVAGRIIEVFSSSSCEQETNKHEGTAVFFFIFSKCGFEVNN